MSLAPRPALALALFATLTASLLAPEHAEAQRRLPRVSSDGIFLGMRGEPGYGLLLGYDLDIYLEPQHVVSLGPAASFSFLDETPDATGRRQELLLTVEVPRLKIALLREEGGSIRVYLMTGVGFYYVSLPEQSGPLRDVRLTDGRILEQVAERFGALQQFGAMWSIGLGFDLFVTDALGFTGFVATYVRLDELLRMPQVWMQAGLGFRFGV